MPLSGTLTKAHIVEAVAEAIGFTRKKSIETVETLLELIKQSLASGDDVLISGFGKFSVKQKAKRKGRNPATGKDMILAPRKVVTFKWSEKLKERLNTKSKTKAKKRRVKSIKKIGFQNATRHKKY
jgi:integration host factor subunit alpha